MGIKHARLVNKYYLNEETVIGEVEQLILQYEQQFDKVADYRKQQLIINHASAVQLWLTYRSDIEIKTEAEAKEVIATVLALRSNQNDIFTTLKQHTNENFRYNFIDKYDYISQKFSQLNESLLLFLESGVNCLLMISIKSGTETLDKRFKYCKLSIKAVNSFTSLLELQMQEVSDIGTGLTSITSNIADDILDKAKLTWEMLPEAIKQDIKWTETIYYIPSGFGNIDEIPIELLYGENTFLGLEKKFSRLSTIEAFSQTLAANRINRKCSKKALLVDSSNVSRYKPLPYAKNEIELVTHSLHKEQYNVTLLTKPTKDELIDELSKGYDIFHYIGHSEADEYGEYLVVNDSEIIRAVHLHAIKDAPAPLVILASCYAGRSRPIAGQGQQGFPAALFNLGSPAIIASTYELPDQVGLQFSTELYKRLFPTTLGNCLQSIKRSFDAGEKNPVCWSPYILFGNANKTLSSLFAEPKKNLSWPSLAIRFFCTESNDYLKQTQARLESDDSINTQQRQQILELLNAIQVKDKNHFSEDFLYDNQFELNDNIEARLVFDAIKILAYIKFSETPDDKTHDNKVKLYGNLLSIQSILHDSYLLVALTDTLTELQDVPFLAESERILFSYAKKALTWIMGDKQSLQQKIESFNYWQQVIEKSIMINSKDMIGVDTETFRKADANDRMAMKRLLSSTLKQQASAISITSKQPWTYWMQRLIGCSGTMQSISDFLGIIEKELKDKKITEQEHNILLRLVEMFFGPDYIDEDTLQKAYTIFEGKELESNIIKAFDYFDLVTTDHAIISQAELENIMYFVKSNLDVMALSYFWGVWCQKEAERGAFETAINEILKLISTLEMLAEKDDEFFKRLGITAILLGQVYNYNNQPSMANDIQKKYADAIEAYQDSEKPD